MGYRNSKYNFGVKVTGVNYNPQPEIKETGYQNNIIKNKEEVNTSNYFNNIKKMILDGTMSSKNAARMVIIELKRVYINCLVNECFGVEEISYMDELLFSNLEEIVFNIIGKAIHNKNGFNPTVYKETISTVIGSSIKILDYEAEFDFDKMNLTINKFVDDFSK